MMPRWNRPPLGPHRRRRDMPLASRSSGAARPHRYGQPHIEKSFTQNLQKARCTNAYGLRDEEYLRLKILTCMLPVL